MTRRPAVRVSVEYVTGAGATVTETASLGQARRTVRALEARTAALLAPDRVVPTQWDDAVADISALLDADTALQAYRSAMVRAGFCRVCLRALRDPVSVGLGIGPDCRRRTETEEAPS